MTIILIAERFNGPTWRPASPIPSRRYLEAMIRLGVYQRGPCREKLRSVGVEFNESMNLLPPDPRTASWDRALARSVATYITEESGWDTLLLCGRAVTQAFAAPTVQYGEPFYSNGVQHIVVPYPFGLRWWWGNTENRIRLKELLDERLSTSRPSAAVPS